MLPVGVGFVRACDGFFEKYYSTVIAKYRESPIFVQDALMLTDMLARIAYSPYYLTILPVLAVALETPGWGAHAVAVLLTLSCHPPARAKIIDKGFEQRVRHHANDPELAGYVELLIQTLRR
jgi:hypothetical protein